MRRTTAGAKKALHTSHYVFFTASIFNFLYDKHKQSSLLNEKKSVLLITVSICESTRLLWAHDNGLARGKRFSSIFALSFINCLAFVDNGVGLHKVNFG